MNKRESELYKILSQISANKIPEIPISGHTWSTLFKELYDDGYVAAPIDRMLSEKTYSRFRITQKGEDKLVSLKGNLMRTRLKTFLKWFLGSIGVPLIVVAAEAVIKKYYP